METPVTQADILIALDWERHAKTLQQDGILVYNFVGDGGQPTLDVVGRQKDTVITAEWHDMSHGTENSTIKLVVTENGIDATKTDASLLPPGRARQFLAQIAGVVKSGATAVFYPWLRLYPVSKKQTLSGSPTQFR